MVPAITLLHQPHMAQHGGEPGLVIAGISVQDPVWVGHEMAYTYYMPMKQSVLDQVSSFIQTITAASGAAPTKVVVSLQEYVALNQELQVKSGAKVHMINGVPIHIGTVSDLPHVIPDTPDVKAALAIQQIQEAQEAEDTAAVKAAVKAQETKIKAAYALLDQGKDTSPAVPYSMQPYMASLMAAADEMKAKTPGFDLVKTLTNAQAVAQQTGNHKIVTLTSQLLGFLEGAHAGTDGAEGSVAPPSPAAKKALTRLVQKLTQTPPPMFQGFKDVLIPLPVAPAAPLMIDGIAMADAKEGEMVQVQLPGGQYMMSIAGHNMAEGHECQFPISGETVIAATSTPVIQPKFLEILHSEGWSDSDLEDGSAFHHDALKALKVLKSQAEAAAKAAHKIKVYHQSGSDEHGTPQALFDVLDQEFHFDLDVCATAAHEVFDWGSTDGVLEAKGWELDPGNAKCPIYFTKEDDGLQQDWFGTVWMNPPYTKGQVGKWIQKLIHELVSGHITRAVALVAARPDTAWFQTAVTYAAEVRFLKGRLTFQGSTNPAPFPSAVLVFDKAKAQQIIKFWVWQKGLAVKYFQSVGPGVAGSVPGPSMKPVPMHALDSLFSKAAKKMGAPIGSGTGLGPLGKALLKSL